MTFVYAIVPKLGDIQTVCPLEMDPTLLAHNLPLCVKGISGAPDVVRNFCGHCENVQAIKSETYTLS